MLAADQLPSARTGAAELDEIAATVESSFLLAAAAQSAGSVLLVEGDVRAALEPLRHAWREWRNLEAPYEAAQTQVLIALAFRSLGDHDTAELEREAARTTFRQLAAVPALRLLKSRFSEAPSAASAITISPREREILRLVAQGKTNRKIGEELFISEKTVERHLSNMFGKLGVSNRAAATAAGFDLGIL